MRKKSLCLITFVSVLVILLTIINTINNAKQNIFTTEKINIDPALDEKIKYAINQLCKGNGVYLFNSEESHVVYFILDGTHVNSYGEALCFSDVKVETKDDLIMIYFSEGLKNYPFGKYPEQKLVYKITKDKNYNYIKIFKNGEETHFDGIGG